MALPSMKQQRDFLKDHLRQQIDFYLTDQNTGINPPPVQRPPRPEQTLIKLPAAPAAHRVIAMDNYARDIAIYFAIRYSGISCVALGYYFGGISGATVSSRSKM